MIDIAPTRSPYIELRQSKIHGTGVYAVKDIPKGSEIIEYVGRKISKKEADNIANTQYEKHKENSENGAVYTFELNKTWDIDGNVPWNTAKYINHSCNPNAEACNTGKKIIIEALKTIKKGEEITYNYGYALENYEDHPCRCGSKNCVGYIVDENEWPKLKKMLAKDKEKKKNKKKK